MWLLTTEVCSLDRSPVHHRTHTVHSYTHTGGQFNLGGRVHGVWEEIDHAANDHTNTGSKTKGLIDF